MYGLKDTDSTKIKSVFSKYRAIDQAILYGSRAKGDFRNGSDIDLCLKGKNLDFNLLLRIETELDDLLLPYTIDLSLYHKIENENLIDHIKRIGLLFYEKQKPHK
jgi:predicted nucleotidyltransferase